MRVKVKDLAHLATTEPAQGPEELAERAHLETRIIRALNELPSAQQQTVQLWQAGHDLRTICEHAGAPRETVLSRKKYAFAKLRQRLADVAEHFAPVATADRCVDSRSSTPKRSTGSLSIA